MYRISKNWGRTNPYIRAFKRKQITHKLCLFVASCLVFIVRVQFGCRDKCARNSEGYSFMTRRNDGVDDVNKKINLYRFLTV